MNSPFIDGKKIWLRGLEKNDLPAVANWANDPEVTHYMFMGTLPVSVGQLEEELEQQQKSGKDAVFAMIDKKTKTHIGNVGFYLINWISRMGEFRIIIGEKEYWSKGYGTEAAKLIVNYGFERLNLNCIFLGVNAENKGAIKSYENAGFIVEGKMRQMIWRNGRYYDAIRMSILREEYYSRKKK